MFLCAPSCCTGGPSPTCRQYRAQSPLRKLLRLPQTLGLGVPRRQGSRRCDFTKSRQRAATHTRQRQQSGERQAGVCRADRRRQFARSCALSPGGRGRRGMRRRWRRKSRQWNFQKSSGRWRARAGLRTIEAGVVSGSDRGGRRQRPGRPRAGRRWRPRQQPVLA